MTPLFRLIEPYVGSRLALVTLCLFYAALMIACTFVLSYLQGAPMIYLDIRPN